MNTQHLNALQHKTQNQREFGRCLLTTLIDERARSNHSRPFASIPRSADPNDGYRDISYRLFRDAINRCVWWLKQQMSLSDRFETLVYVGAFDLRYQILANAAVKTGYVMFFISPRNSLDSQFSLIDDAKVSKILVSSGAAIELIVKPILQKRPMQKFVVPELEYLLAESENVPHFGFEGTFEEYRMKPWILLHTSGSTSSPKIVTIKHGYPTSFDAYWLSAENSDLIATLGQRRMFIPFPPFHMAGIIVNLACSMYVDATIVLPPAAAPLTAGLVNDICVNAKVEVANLPPFILIDMIKNPAYLKCLRGLKDLAYGGGPLPQQTGDEINSFVRITSFFGSTEGCIVPSLVRPREHWKYFKFDVEFGGIEFRVVENSTDLYELVFVRDPRLNLVQAIFVTFPDINEYHSKDLFTKHPTELDLWRYEGRLDDIIVLSNAEKINPVAMEGTITSCPLVSGALVVGTGRFQTALLVEVENPPEPGQTEERARLLDSIWPFVDMANQQCPAYGQISRELIGFARAEKPFLRASKGTIQRAPTLQAYSKEIDELYAQADDVRLQSAQIISRGVTDVDNMEEFLQRWFHDSRVGGVEVEQDFFNTGLDSLDVVNLTRRIRLMGHDISTKQIYDNPTIKRLAMSLKNSHTRHDNERDAREEALATLRQLFHDFKFDAAENKQHTGNSTNEMVNSPKHVVLIGSTGSLGPYLLNGLLVDPTITRVTCLNRSADAPSRQKSKHSALSLTTDFHQVRFLKSDMSEANLGLGLSTYEELLASVTHIIYNAWTVDFNQSISSFKPLLQSVNNIVRFAYECMPLRPRLFFMSSVSVADKQRIERPGDLVHETIIEDWTLAEMGYGQSKLVAEALISDAADRYGIDAAICRLCQLGGPVNHKGEWTRAEWIPSLMLSSKTMGVIPESLGVMDMVDWLPIDLVADICLELLFHDVHDRSQEVREQDINDTNAYQVNDVPTSSRQIRVWHVVNPHPTLWSQLLPSVLQHMPSNAKPVTFVQWVDKLTQGNDTTPTQSTWDVEHVPSLKLIPLFKRLKEHTLNHRSALPVPAFNTSKTILCSNTLAGVPAVNSSWMKLWMKQWET